VRKLRVALETQFAYGDATGLGVYAAQLRTALQQRDDVEVVELCDPRFDVWRFDRRLYWDQFAAPRRAAQAQPDVTHFTGGTLPWRTPHPCVLTLHDLAWLRRAVPGRFYGRWYFGALQGRLARRADHIAADTECARRDVIERLGIDPARVAVTGAGVENAFFALERQLADPPFVLSVGTVEERKDLATALRMLVNHPDLRLIAVGPHTRYAQTLRRLAADLGVAQRFEMRGYVEDRTLLALYAGALALVFPSWYEGFGLPPLQALAAQLPVVASDIPVMREVLGDCAWFAPPRDADAFSAALSQVRRAGHDAKIRIERGRMWARQFTWPAVAEKTVRLYKSLVFSAPARQ